MISIDQPLVPPVVFGTSLLGNLYQVLPEPVKCAIVGECFNHSPQPVFFDTAGKYGAGLALESLGNCLRANDVSPKDVIISNKLGWLRTDLKTEEPQFEPGVRKGQKHDAVQRISYKGILECYEQGNELLNGYDTQLVSVHDPDEYLQGVDTSLAHKKYEDIIDAYRALFELKQQGKVSSVGIGANDWRIIQ